MKATTILDTIGGTPHVRIQRLFGSDHHVWIKQERANPLALNTPGSLFICMDKLCCLCLHNDLCIWAIGRVGRNAIPPYIFSAMRSFALRALGLFFVSSAEGVNGFRFTSFSVALRSTSYILS